MIRSFFLAAILAASLMSVSPGEAQAWGVAHAGYTHVGPAGAYHVGTTTRVGPGGVSRTASAGAVGAGGARVGYSAGAAYRAPGPAVGGYRAGGAVGYRAGAYRVP